MGEGLEWVDFFEEEGNVLAEHLVVTGLLVEVHEVVGDMLGESELFTVAEVLVDGCLVADMSAGDVQGNQLAVAELLVG